MFSHSVKCIDLSMLSLGFFLFYPWPGWLACCTLECTQTNHTIYF